MASNGGSAEPTPLGKRRRALENEEGSPALPRLSDSNQLMTSPAEEPVVEGDVAWKRAIADWQAAAKAFEGLQAEVKRLEGELEKANERGASSDAELAKVRKSLTVKEKECVGKAKEIKRLEAAELAWSEKQEKMEEASLRRAQEGNRFHFVLAATGQAGSIPRSYLESDPESLLSKMFNGEWDYARDEQGRALINCHPDRWAAILEHLATGTLPIERDQRLLDQARHWNLGRLVQALEALTPGVTVTRHPGGRSCTVQCRFVSVMEQLRDDEDNGPRLTFSFPENQLWALEVQRGGIYLSALAQDDEEDVPDKNVLCKMRLLLKDTVIQHILRGRSLAEFHDSSGYGFPFESWGYGYHELISEPLARAYNTIVVELELCIGK